MQVAAEYVQWSEKGITTLAGLPHMCAEALARCSQGVNLAFTDIDATYAVRQAVPNWTVIEGADASLPTATTTAHDFISWGTNVPIGRPMGVSVDGAAAATLDAFNII